MAKIPEMEEGSWVEVGITDRKTEEDDISFAPPFTHWATCVEKAWPHPLCRVHASYGIFEVTIVHPVEEKEDESSVQMKVECDASEPGRIRLDHDPILAEVFILTCK